MGSRIGGRQRQRGITLIAVSLAMLLAYIPALAAQAPAGPVVSGDQNGSRPAPPGGAGVCGHSPGEFLVGYESEEALRAAPQENVVDTIESILVQYVAYDEIKNEPDPAVRSAAEEAKKQELEAWPGVNYVEYNCSAAAEARAAPPVADCGECGANIGRLAARVIGGSEGADGKNAYQVALEAARSADEGNVALASEVEGEDANVDPEEESIGGTSDGTGANPGETGGTDEPTEAGEIPAGEITAGEITAEGTTTEGTTTEKANAEEVTAEETSTGGAASEDTGKKTVENAAVSGDSRVGSPLLALGGGMLLVAGIFLARKAFAG